MENGNEGRGRNREAVVEDAGERERILGVSGLGIPFPERV